ncbi:MAG: extracellular solute-binding protein [Pseudobutyrivibrio sp.]|nr:extracellular solute-binding protein [Pseudobutyrivibrio sp.]
MKKNLQKLMALGLVGAMAVSMVACGSNEQAPAQDAAAAPAATETTEAPAAAVAGIDGFEAFAENVEIIIPVYQRDTPNGAADAADNYWTKWVQSEFGDKYNVTVTYRAYHRGDENNLYAMDAAAGDLPSICFEYDYPDVTLYQNEGYFQTYDPEWFKQIAPTYWAAMEENGLDAYTDINGETVLLIGTRPYGKTNYQFVTFYRADWAEAAGYDEYPLDPKDQDAMYAKIYELGLCGDHILGGVKVEGNGVDQNYAYRKYPQDELLWATTGDYSVPALSTEAQKAFLKRQNQLYNLGYIDDEYNTRTSDLAIADFVNGDCMTYSCYSTNNIDVLNQFYENNPEGKLGIVVNPGVKDFSDGSNTAFRPNGIFGEYIGFSSSCSEDQMKAVAMYLEWMSQPDVLKTMQWGFEGKNYTVENGVMTSVADQSALAEQQGHNNNVDMWCLITATRSLGDVDADIKAIAPAGYPDSDELLKDIKANYEGQLACYEGGYASPDCMFQVSIAANDEYKDTLFSKYAELRDMVVMGKEADFEANYEKASKEYLAAGYQAIIDEKAEAFNAGNYN